MATHAENLAQWLQRYGNYRAARAAKGYTYPGAASVYEALACSGLPSAGKGLADAEKLLVTEVVSDFLNPPAPPAPPMPPRGVHFTILGRDVVTNEPVWVLDPEYGLGAVFAGTNGAGKTCALAVALQAVPVPVLIYAPDTKKEIYRIFTTLPRNFLYIKPSQLFRNILECPTADPVTYYTGLIELLAHILGIDDATWPELASILIEMRLTIPADKPMPCLAEWVSFLRMLGDRRKKGKFHTAANRFMILAVAYSEVAYVRQGPDLSARYSAIGVNFAGVSHQIREATDAHAAYYILQTKSAHGHTADLSVIIPHDEGLNTFGRSFSNTAGSRVVTYQETLTAQGRSYGIGRIILLQYIRQGMDTVFANSGVLLIMRLPDPDEARLAAKFLGLPDEMIPVIMNLPNGEAFIKTPNFTVARRIRVTTVSLPSYPSETEIAAAMAPEIQWMRANSIMAPSSAMSVATDIDYVELMGYGTSPAVIAPTPTDDAACALLADWVEFLNVVIAHPDAKNITQLYSHLSWGTQRCHRIKTLLVEAGLLDVQKATAAGGRPALRIVPTAKALLSLEALKTS